MGRRGAGGLAATTAALALLTACTGAGGAGDGAERDTDPASASASTSPLLQVTSPHEETGMTLLEGPTFGPDGDLYVVDVTAPPGEPKVMRIDVESQEVSTVYTDDRSAFTSAQFSPADGRLYLTDIAGSAVTSITPDGRDPRVEFSGEVDGVALRPDDLTFDPDGHIFVSDFSALPGATLADASTGGRVVRIDHDSGDATVLASGLPSPNGISFDEDHTALWVSQYAANRIDLLRLDETRTEVVSSNPGMHVDGGRTQVDSNAVDADGNVYQGYHLLPAITVHSPDGELLRTISVPREDTQGLESATNLAIAPGTTDGYLTVSGPDGGFVYTFDALAQGTRQSNGG